MSGQCQRVTQTKGQQGRSLRIKSQNAKSLHQLFVSVPPWLTGKTPHTEYFPSFLDYLADATCGVPSYRDMTSMISAGRASLPSGACKPLHIYEGLFWPYTNFLEIIMVTYTHWSGQVSRVLILSGNNEKSKVPIWLYFLIKLILKITNLMDMLNHLVVIC